MSRRPAARCAWCGEVVPHGGPTVYRLDIDSPGGRVVIGWHRPACLEADPSQEPFADACSLDDGPAAEEATTTAHLAMLATLRARHGERVREVVQVRREPADPTMTLRGHGDAWGRCTRRGAR